MHQGILHNAGGILIVTKNQVLCVPKNFNPGNICQADEVYIY